MNITLSPAQLVGLDYATTQRNAANPNASPMTSEQFAADLLGVQCDQFAAQRDDAMKQLMGPVAQQLIAAANGDPAKLQTALEAGIPAALAAIA